MPIVDNANKLAYLFFDIHDQNLSNWHFCGVFFVQITLFFTEIQKQFYLFHFIYEPHIYINLYWLNKQGLPTWEAVISEHLDLERQYRFEQHIPLKIITAVSRSKDF